MQKLAATLLLLIFSATAVFAQTSSSAEKRQWAVETTRWLEQNPLDPGAKGRAAELLAWWTEVPDLTLSVCPLLIETKNKKVAPTAVSQAVFAAGAHLIEHPDATRTDLSLAGVEGALRAYRNAVAADPQLRDKFLDRLLEEQAEGKLLEGYVARVVAKCEAGDRSK